MFCLKRALYGMVGLSMLAMPATALAGPPSLILVRHNHHGWYHRVCDEDGDDWRKPTTRFRLTLTGREVVNWHRFQCNLVSRIFASVRDHFQQLDSI
jgi:hypothetical protein